jgi:hypothetical protein
MASLQGSWGHPATILHNAEKDNPTTSSAE